MVRPWKEFVQLDDSEIFSYSNWLPGEAPPAYSEWNETRLHVVRTWKTEKKLQQRRHELLNLYLDSAAAGMDILTVMDGLIVMPDQRNSLRKLLPDQLSHVDTVEVNFAKTLYGSIARSVNLLVNTYKPQILRFKQ